MPDVESDHTGAGGVGLWRAVLPVVSRDTGDMLKK